MEIIFLLIGISILLKISNIILNLVKSILGMIISLLGILVIFKITYKWVLVPLFKLIKWSTYHFRRFSIWLGNKMIEHFSYRNDNNYWYLVANSMDRFVIKSPEYSLKLIENN